MASSQLLATKYDRVLHKRHCQKMEIYIYISPIFVYHNYNRVGNTALSAAGTGRCPEDEGLIRGGVSAPAVAYGNPPLCSNDTRSDIDWFAVRCF